MSRSRDVYPPNLHLIMAAPAVAALSAADAGTLLFAIRDAWATDDPVAALSALPWADPMLARALGASEVLVAQAERQLRRQERLAARRIAQEAADRAALIEQKREAGRLGGAARWGDGRNGTDSTDGRHGRVPSVPSVLPPSPLTPQPPSASQSVLAVAVTEIESKTDSSLDEGSKLIPRARAISIPAPGEALELLPLTPAVRVRRRSVLRAPPVGDAPLADGEMTVEQAFDEYFWPAWPSGRKIDRKECRTAFLALFKRTPQEKHQPLFNAIMEGLKGWIEQWTAEKRTHDRIPHPLTWLHRERWEATP